MNPLDRTADILLASFITARDLARLKGIEGEPGRRVFVFDRAVDPATLVAFHSSPEKRVLDVFKSLKQAVLTG